MDTTSTWRQVLFKDQEVFAEVDGEGVLVARSGRVAIRYSAAEGARVYRASVSRVTIVEGSAVRELPPGVDADAAKAGGGKAAKKGGSKASRGSGFGKAGSRSPAQAAAAAAAARERIAALSADTTLVFTDGACRGNPGPAGSGVVVVAPDGGRTEACRSLGRATNNVAELTAIAMALELLDEGEVPLDAPVALFSDSGYADGVLTKGWKAKANAALIGDIRAALRRRTGLTIHWVAGHVGIDGNERADALANMGVSGVSRTTRGG